MKITTPNPLLPFLCANGVMIIDGGLATTLEAQGCNLDSELWSASILVEDPDSISNVHRDFLDAGADCIIASTYQASYEGFARRGLSEAEATSMMQQSVQLAVRARDAFWSIPENRVGRERPLVAASVGPYGAYLANGAEYTGDYGVGSEDLLAFHTRRWRVLAEAGADFLMCETIPSIIEVNVLLLLAQQTPGTPVCICFCCKDGQHLGDGTRVIDAAHACDELDAVVAVGINCTAPQYISALIPELKTQTRKPVIVYPNSGERYDATRKTWAKGEISDDPVTQSLQWKSLGAAGIGGCCRVGPGEIARMKIRLTSEQEKQE